MAKAKVLHYFPTSEEINSAYVCNNNDLAYVIQPTQNANKYRILKFKISNRLELFTYKENDIEILCNLVTCVGIKIEFTEYDALKKTMELYKLHAKRFTK